MAEPAAAAKAGRQPSRLAVEQAGKPFLEREVQATLDGMARYASPSDKALGVAMKDIKGLGKTLGRKQELAAALWDTGVYEARMLASFVGDPDQITPAQMDRWCSEFDNWAFCDAMCFKLFDRTPHPWDMVAKWSKRRSEFEKRTAFALLWSLSVHDKRSSDDQFIRGLALIEHAADDERNFVKKAVNMALRAIGKRNAARRRRPRGFVSRELAHASAPIRTIVGHTRCRK